MNSKNHSLFSALERFTFSIAIVGILLLSLAYFGIPSLRLDPNTRELFQDIIANLIASLIIFVLIYVTFYRRIQAYQSEQEIEKNNQRIIAAMTRETKKALIEHLGILDFKPPNQQLWLLTADQLLEIESGDSIEEVWVITPHLLNDTSPVEHLPGPTSTVEIVQANLNRDVRYTFIVPETKEITARLPQLKQNYELREITNLEIVMLPEEVHASITFAEIVIYNPSRRSSQSMHLYLQLPVPPPNSYYYWIHVEEVIASQILQRLNIILSMHNH